jgi:hypothetical protein
MRRTTRHIPFLLASAAAAALITASSCKREERGFRVDAPAAETTDKVVMSDLRPGSLQVTATQPAASQQAASGRPDHMKGPPPPNSTTRESPKQSFLPKSAEMPG